MQSCMVHNCAIRIFKRVSKNISLKVKSSKMGSNLRWAFNVSRWKPTEDEVLAASSFIQREEKERISKFVFQIDAMSSLIGRLMMRKFVHISTSMPYNEIIFGRDGHGKPYLLGAGDKPVTFNVSHQGDYVVLAGNNVRNIGVDVMNIEPPINKNIPEFFCLMQRQFSREEWSTIKSFSSEMEQVACFYRMWCLKESYVKNIGLGITIPLHEISFAIKTRNLKVGNIVVDTKLYEKSVLKSDWVFEEALLDDKHVVAVSYEAEKEEDIKLTPFVFLSFDELIKEAVPLVESDKSFRDEFMKKQMKHF